MSAELPRIVGRGSHINPANRFDRVHQEDDWEQVEGDADFLSTAGQPLVDYLPDASQSIVSSNDSPDIPFRYSVNPYRGCAHGCAYCYARPTHEYLGFGAGLDFETKILVKHRAPQLLREFLLRKSWQVEQIVFSGVTDCYQPCERQFRLTRGCLEVAVEFRQPIGIITKNALICRDLDLLAELAKFDCIHANLSLTTLDADLARALEPRTSTPAARLRAIERLAVAGIPVRVMTAPIIPGLTDHEVPALLDAAASAGAQSAGYNLLRLPLTVQPVFLEWLDRAAPFGRERVEALQRATRDGALNSSAFGERLRGQGPIAAQIKQLFQVFAGKHGLDRALPAYSSAHFRRPEPTNERQLRLF